MKYIKSGIIMLMTIGLCIGLITPIPGSAQESLRFSCSAQLFDILQNDVLDRFTKKTGTEVELYVTSSEAALYRLYNQASDVAGTAERIHLIHGDYGFTETQICKAPIVVITDRTNPVNSLTVAQLQSIFSGEITNWKAVGGEDRQIVCVVPDKNTAAYRNFSQLALKRLEISYAIMTKRSTMVVDVIQHIPGSISFITKGNNSRDNSIKILQVDGIYYTDPAYPFFQSFSLVTRSRPSSDVKKFVSFITSEQVAEVLRDNGIAAVFQ